MNRFILLSILWFTAFIICLYQVGVITGLHIKNYWMISGIIGAGLFLFQRLKKFGFAHYPSVLPFSKVFRILALIILPSVFMGSLVNEVYRKVVHPDLAALELKSGKQSIEIKEVENGNEQVTAEAMQASVKINRNPVVMISSSLIKSIIIGNLIALTGAALLRREPDHDQEASQ
jgi:hypothetical protein